MLRGGGETPPEDGRGWGPNSAAVAAILKPFPVEADLLVGVDGGMQGRLGLRLAAHRPEAPRLQPGRR